ncbi:MAG: hypothetical protein K8H88_01490, partial [Sandaracinaceae bacterium]|nr:hypothetical protein [Sandaracinaceae bacterium]
MRHRVGELALIGEVVREDQARGDPRMLADLIMMATVNTDSLRVEATTAIVDWYGDEALPPIEAQ